MITLITLHGMKTNINSEMFFTKAKKIRIKNLRGALEEIKIKIKFPIDPDRSRMSNPSILEKLKMNSKKKTNFRIRKVLKEKDTLAPIKIKTMK